MAVGRLGVLKDQQEERAKARVVAAVRIERVWDAEQGGNCDSCCYTKAAPCPGHGSQEQRPSSPEKSGVGDYYYNYCAGLLLSNWVGRDVKKKKKSENPLN